MRMAKAAAAPAAAMKEASLYCPSAAPPVVAAAEAEDAVAEPEVEVLSVPDLVVDEDFVVLASAVPLTVVSEPLAVVVLEAVVVEVLPEVVVEVLSEVVAEAPEVEVLDAPVVQATVLGRSVTPPAEQIALAAFRVSSCSAVVHLPTMQQAMSLRKLLLPQIQATSMPQLAGMALVAQVCAQVGRELS